MTDKPESALLFDILTPLGFKVHCTQEYWQHKVVADHPIMADRVEEVKRALTSPKKSA